MQPEVHLFLIWNNGQIKRQEIIADIQSKFEIIDVLNIQWDGDNFAQNLSRFYGQSLPAGSLKELECGKGPFTLIVIRDQAPIYEERQTTRGRVVVNARMFDAKTLYRTWIGYGCKIHGTNNPQETRKDILLLTGNTYEHYEKQGRMISSIPDKIIDHNLMGCIQWQSLEELFAVLNETLDYVVLRNFDEMPQSYYASKHGDIDLLVSNLKQTIYLCNATAVFTEKYRVHYKVNINYQTVRFDIRFVGDNYYDQKWEQDILKTRQWNNGFYIPREDHYQYSLLYHALMHKTIIAKDYHEKFIEFGLPMQNPMQQLAQFMHRNNYQFVEPFDHSVYFNAKSIDRSTSLKRKYCAGITLAKRITNKAWKRCTEKGNAGVIRLRAIIKRVTSR